MKGKSFYLVLHWVERTDQIESSPSRKVFRYPPDLPHLDRLRQKVIVETSCLGQSLYSISGSSRDLAIFICFLQRGVSRTTFRRVGLSVDIDLSFNTHLHCTLLILHCILPFFLAYNRQDIRSATASNKFIMNARPFPYTLAMIKPDILLSRDSTSKIHRIKDMMHQQKLRIATSPSSTPMLIRKQLSKSVAEKFYEEHKGKFFYQRLVSFMTSGPIEVYVLTPLDHNKQQEFDIIAEWRKLMGPTHIER